MSVNKFSQIIERSPSEMKGRKNDFELWKTYEEAIAIHKHKGSKRYYVYAKRGGDYLTDKDMVLTLVDEEICISNQWSLDAMNPFINLMRSKGVRTE